MPRGNVSLEAPDRRARPEWSDRGPDARRLLPWLIVLLQGWWWSVGVFPIVPVEGDEQGVLFGVEALLHPDPALERLRYLYEVQPGSYRLLATLAHVSGARPEIVFGLATAAGAVAFALAGAALLRTLFGWPFAWLLVVLGACQEVATAGWYSNTSALAGWAALCAVMVGTGEKNFRWLWGGLLLGLAGWLRADSLLVAPACLGLAYWRGRSWRPALVRTFALAGVTLASMVLLYRLSGLSPLAGFHTYVGRGFDLSGARILFRVPFHLLSPLLAGAALLGCLLLLWRREFALALVAISGSAASLAAYGTSLTTPKYFYYLVPFALVPALYLIGTLRLVLPRLPPWPRRLAILTAAVAILADGALGLRTLSTEQQRFTALPTWATLARTATATGQLSLVLGPGDAIINADGFRLRTGQWFAPFSWHREKQRDAAALASIRSWIAGGGDLTLFWSSWLPWQVVRRELLAANFRPRLSTEEGASGQEIWKNGLQTVRVGFLGYVGSPYQPPGAVPAERASPRSYFVGDPEGRLVTEIDDGRRWARISPSPLGFLVLYRRE
jgi:hypothetical protein